MFIQLRDVTCTALKQELHELVRLSKDCNKKGPLCRQENTQTILLA